MTSKSVLGFCRGQEVLSVTAGDSILGFIHLRTVRSQ